nr:MAG TPA: hypothetical protein [Caudoviricetes sp.]
MWTGKKTRWRALCDTATRPLFLVHKLKYKEKLL